MPARNTGRRSGGNRNGDDDDSFSLYSDSDDESVEAQPQPPAPAQEPSERDLRYLAYQRRQEAAAAAAAAAAAGLPQPPPPRARQQRPRREAAAAPRPPGRPTTEEAPRFFNADSPSREEAERELAPKCGRLYDFVSPLDLFQEAKQIIDKPRKFPVEADKILEVVKEEQEFRELNDLDTDYKRKIFRLNAKLWMLLEEEGVAAIGHPNANCQEIPITWNIVTIKVVLTRLSESCNDEELALAVEAIEALQGEDKIIKENFNSYEARLELLDRILTKMMELATARKELDTDLLDRIRTRMVKLAGTREERRTKGGGTDEVDDDDDDDEGQTDGFYQDVDGDDDDDDDDDDDYEEPSPPAAAATARPRRQAAAAAAPAPAPAPRGRPVREQSRTYFNAWASDRDEAIRELTPKCVRLHDDMITRDEFKNAEEVVFDDYKFYTPADKLLEAMLPQFPELSNMWTDKGGGEGKADKSWREFVRVSILWKKFLLRGLDHANAGCAGLPIAWIICLLRHVFRRESERQPSHRAELSRVLQAIERLLAKDVSCGVGITQTDIHNLENRKQLVIRILKEVMVIEGASDNHGSGQEQRMDGSQTDSVDDDDAGSLHFVDQATDVDFRLDMQILNDNQADVDRLAAQRQQQQQQQHGDAGNGLNSEQGEDGGFGEDVDDGPSVVTIRRNTSMASASVFATTEMSYEDDESFVADLDDNFAQVEPAPSSERTVLAGGSLEVEEDDDQDPMVVTTTHAGHDGQHVAGTEGAQLLRTLAALGLLEGHHGLINFLATLAALGLLEGPHGFANLLISDEWVAVVKASRKLGAVARGSLQKSRFVKTKLAIIRIQAASRGWLQKNRFVKSCSAIVRIQATSRDWIQKLRYKRIQESHHRAASKVQALARMIICRGKHVRSNCAAIQLQATVRLWVQRLRYRGLQQEARRLAAIRFQHSLLATMKARRLRRRLAMVKIQRFVVNAHVRRLAAVKIHSFLVNAHARRVARQKPVIAAATLEGSSSVEDYVKTVGQAKATPKACREDEESSRYVAEADQLQKLCGGENKVVKSPSSGLSAGDPEMLSAQKHEVVVGGKASVKTSAPPKTSNDSSLSLLDSESLAVEKLATSPTISSSLEKGRAEKTHEKKASPSADVTRGGGSKSEGKQSERKASPPEGAAGLAVVRGQGKKADREDNKKSSSTTKTKQRVKPHVLVARLKRRSAPKSSNKVPFGEFIRGRAAAKK